MAAGANKAFSLLVPWMAFWFALEIIPISLPFAYNVLGRPWNMFLIIKDLNCFWYFHTCIHKHSGLPPITSAIPIFFILWIPSWFLGRGSWLRKMTLPLLAISGSQWPQEKNGALKEPHLSLMECYRIPSCAGVHRCCLFVTTMAMSYLDSSILWHSSLSSSSKSHPLLFDVP